MAGQREVGLDGQAPGAVDLGAGLLGERRARREAVTPAAQMTVRVGIRSVAVAGALDRHAAVVDVRRPVSPSSGVTPRCSSARGRLAPRALGGKRSGRGRPPRRAGPRACAGRRCGSRRAACRARSRRSGPPSRRRSARRRRRRRSASARRRSGSCSSSAASKAVEDPAADVERALERLELGRVLPPLVVAEVGVAATPAATISVSYSSARAPCRSAPSPQRDAPRGEVEARHLGEQRRARCARRLKMRAQRVAISRRRERARRHLVGERLEEVEVAPVDQRDLDRRARAARDGLKAAEAAADDDDAVR